jgi:NAD(P)-dependent dehydrogenase (short-subunit alcohol dehydrogenase family)
LGLETCAALGRLGYTVLLTSPVLSPGRAAAKSLAKDGCDVYFHQLDVTSAGAVKEVKQFVRQEFGRLDVLVNNAGVLLDEGKSILRVPVETFQKVLDINTFGALRMCQAFLPLMLRQDYGRIVNLASGRGQLSGEDIGEYAPAYSMSKNAVNALTVMFSHAAAGTNVLVNSVCPGWCRTKMGGPHAQRSARKGAETIVWLATLPDGGHSGGFFRDKELIPW